MTQLEQSEKEWLKKTPTKSAFPENISNKNVNFLEINTKMLHNNHKKMYQITTHGIKVKKSKKYLKSEKKQQKRLFKIVLQLVCMKICERHRQQQKQEQYFITLTNFQRLLLASTKVTAAPYKKVEKLTATNK